MREVIVSSKLSINWPPISANGMCIWLKLNEIDIIIDCANHIFDWNRNVTQSTNNNRQTTIGQLE